MNYPDEIKIGSLIITSRSRYGTVVDIDFNNVPRALVKIGNAYHWINYDQLILAKDSVTFKVYYNYVINNELKSASEEVILRKNTVLYNIDNNNDTLLNKIVNILNAKIPHRVFITEIKIS